MRINHTGIVETAAIGCGVAVKKGVAAHGVVKAGAREKTLGVADLTNFNDEAAVGEQLSVAVDGLVKALAGGAFSKGDSLTTDANGRAISINGVSTSGTPMLQITLASLNAMTIDIKGQSTNAASTAIGEAIAGISTAVFKVNRLGIAMEAAGAADELVEIMVTNDEVIV